MQGKITGSGRSERLLPLLLKSNTTEAKEGVKSLKAHSSK